ncbi:hypothetical protein SeMB42_g01173 [Synchytrium endobioticum]|uniref:Uncharacterized protein n=1 Tax=Synchytrium endobioticum TaxID=286115 RepID=A0A507DPF6_9FUNG|nr:hypothetical protein SeMB42_g01173 [Synchytrium endobioticum]
MYSSITQSTLSACAEPRAVAVNPVIPAASAVLAGSRKRKLSNARGKTTPGPSRFAGEASPQKSPNEIAFNDVDTQGHERARLTPTDTNFHTISATSPGCIYSTVMTVSSLEHEQDTNLGQVPTDQVSCTPFLSPEPSTVNAAASVGIQTEEYSRRSGKEPAISPECGSVGDWISRAFAADGDSQLTGTSSEMGHILPDELLEDDDCSAMSAFSPTASVVDADIYDSFGFFEDPPSMSANPPSPFTLKPFDPDTLFLSADDTENVDGSVDESLAYHNLHHSVLNNQGVTDIIGAYTRPTQVRSKNDLSRSSHHSYPASADPCMIQNYFARPPNRPSGVLSVAAHNRRLESAPSSSH